MSSDAGGSTDESAEDQFDRRSVLRGVAAGAVGAAGTGALAGTAAARECTYYCCSWGPGGCTEICSRCVYYA